MLKDPSLPRDNLHSEGGMPLPWHVCYIYIITYQQLLYLERFTKSFHINSY